MPFRPRHSFLRVDSSSLRNSIETDSVEDLHGMWSLFSKTSHAIDSGRRLENLTWRLWNRETFCCKKARENPTLSESAIETTSDDSLPALSSSYDSSSSEDELGPPKSPPELKCGTQCDKRHETHITSHEMQKMIQSIEETKDLQPKDLEPIELPAPSSPAGEPTDAAPSLAASQDLPTLQFSSAPATAPSSATTPQPSSVSASRATLLESSASTVDTQDDTASQTVGSEGSSNTEMSTHSIVRGFVPGGAPSSYRSQTTLNPQPTPILKNSPHYHSAAKPRKKGAMFTIGTSSGEDESSFESHMHKSSFARSSLSESLRQNLDSAGSKKQTSFKEEIAIGRAAHSPVFESDDEDEDVSESAIEDDDDSSDWEDSDDHSGPSSVNENAMFQRVDSRPNLTSRRSLLTTMMHEPDRARALQNAASKSTSAIRRSNRGTPNGPSLATSPEPQPIMPVPAEDDSRSKPIIMTTSNLHTGLSLSPRTTRRNMLSTELTESLRKNLLWERQHRSTGNLAALKRRPQPELKPQPELRQRPEPGPVLSQTERGKFSNDYFNAGLQEYHAKGW